MSPRSQRGGDEQLCAITDAFAGGPVGLSPSDVPGLVVGSGLPRSPRMIWILLRCGSGCAGVGVDAVAAGLYFQSAVGVDSGAGDVYVAQIALDFAGDFDVVADGAARLLMARHAVLRSAYVPVSRVRSWRWCPGHRGGGRNSTCAKAQSKSMDVGRRSASLRTSGGRRSICGLRAGAVRGGTDR